MWTAWREEGKKKQTIHIHGRTEDTDSPKSLDSRGIEPRTTPMLREYYTTKPQALADDNTTTFLTT